MTDILNERYVRGCKTDGTSVERPDCGHEECGVLCDVELRARRPDGEVSNLVAGYHSHENGLKLMGAPELRKLLARGFTLVETARLLGVPLDLVVRPLRRYCRGAISIEQLLDVERRLRAGGEYGEVARECGLTRHEVRDFARFLGLTSPRVEDQRKYEQVRPLALELFEQGHTRIQIAERLGVPPRTVRRWVAA